jgi:hypothetical protein
MGSHSTRPLEDLMKQAQGMLAVNPMIVPQLEQLLKAQDTILDEAERFTRAWFERRHAAMRSALDVAREASGNGSAGSTSALQAMSDWQRGSTERMTEDVRCWLEFCTRCTGHFAAGETEARKEGVEVAEKRATQPGKWKHATPV